MIPQICIILVNYNSEKDTFECVESLKRIEYENYYIIVVDNASLDEGALEPLKQDCTVIFSSENLGFSGGNNLGIQSAKEIGYDYILFLNNDTIVQPDFLKILVSTAETEQSVGIVCGKIYFYKNPKVLWYAGGEINFAKGGIEHWDYNKIDTSVDGKCQDVSFATGCMWLVPRDVIEQVGELAEDYFLYSEDADYCCRVVQNKLRIIYEPKAIIYHKVGASSKKSIVSQYYSTRNDFFIFDKYAPVSIRKKAKRALLMRKIKETIAGNISFKLLIRGYIDYRKGIKGRNETKIK